LRSRAKFRNGLIQHRFDQAALFTADRLVKRGKPATDRLERGLAGPRGDDTGNADLNGLLFMGKQDFVQTLAGPHARENDLDIVAGLQA